MSEHEWLDVSPESLGFMEGLYEQWLRDPNAVDAHWGTTFAGWKARARSGNGNGSTNLNGNGNGNGNGAYRTAVGLGPTFRPATVFNPPTAVPTSAAALNFSPRMAEMAARQDRVDQLIRAYRVRGHMLAKLDPLGLPRAGNPELELSHYELSEADLDLYFSSRTIVGSSVLTLRQILERLTNTYCGAIGVQFMHIDDLRTKDWLQNRMESTENKRTLSRDEQLRILTKLTDAEIFEDFVHKKFLGAKRFSLEGAESLVPLLDLAIESAAEHGAREIVLGMPHRGRLNVLVNIMGKSAREIFREFEDRDPHKNIGGGDVKYHMGYSTDYPTTSGRAVHLSLCFNPSHLEFVGPVALGRARAKQDRAYGGDRAAVLPIAIHGDAAIAGQGVVQEMLNMSGLPGYTAGGTLHIVVNNQVGFTTPPESARSTQYATDVAKMLQIPIFHVNGEDPAAVAQVIQVAMDFRQEFKKDVVIDMYCYRRYGHNEGDDPSFTQPVMYAAIRQRKSVREGYVESLRRIGGLDADDAHDIVIARKAHLEDELSAARSDEFKPRELSRGIWTGYVGGADKDVPEVPTTVPPEALSGLLRVQTTVPKHFHLHPKIVKLLDTRAEMADGRRPLDWGAGEAAAYASLVAQGTHVRLAGQDAGRGTFSHRHAVLHDYATGGRYVPLQHVTDTQAGFEVYDSPLTETGVLGFEYGVSLDWPDRLVLWEAQFGDFCNVAQVIIDQFIASGEDKWGRLSGLVLLLPHGFEGQGPEHSSARLERFLTMSAEDNMQVVNLTTPAQFFHCVRRQVMRPFRKPLVVMSPKSLLRHPEAVSTLDDLAHGRFQRLLADTSGTPVRECTRLLLCSGKLYYELDAERRRRGATHVHIVRFEQLYPLSRADLEAVLGDYAEDTDTVWVQEEPLNNGAWTSIRMRFGDRVLGRLPLRVLGREASASPSDGSAKAHAIVQQRILDEAVGGEA